MRYELSDYEWTAIKPMLPNRPRGVRRVNDRRVLNGIFWVLRSGAPWRDLPERTTVPAPPATIASFGGGGLASGTGSWMHRPPVVTRRCR
jgi:transposase